MSTIANNLEQEEENRRKGTIAGVIATIAIIIFFVLPLLSRMTPPPGQEGVLISFGSEDVGDGLDQPYAPIDNVETSESSEEEDVEPEPQPEQPEPQPSEPEPTPVEEVQEVETSETSDVVIKKEEPKEKKEPKEETQDNNKPKDNTSDNTSEAKEEPKKPKKPVAGSLFGKKESGSQGNTGKPGDQGNPDGDPNAGALEGSSSGLGDKDIGGGLKGRGLAYRPKVSENSQKSGKVRVNICVNPDGSVIESSYTQRGSTTNDSNLIATALRNAKKFKFKKNSLAPDKQCGYITFDFKVQ